MGNMQTMAAEVDTSDAVVVTGGMGFIGSFVADAYLEQGRKVVLSSTPSSAPSSRPRPTRSTPTARSSR